MSTPLLLEDASVGGGYSHATSELFTGCVNLQVGLGWVVGLSKLQKLKLFIVIYLVSRVLVNLLDEYSSNKIRG